MRALAIFSGFGLVIAGFLLQMLIAPGAIWFQFFDGPILITMAMCTFGGLCLSYGPRAALAAISHGFWNSHNLPDEQRAESANVLEAAGRYVWATVTVVTTIGVIITLSNIDDSEAIAPSLVVVMLPLLYGAVLAEFILRPLKLSLAQQRPPLPNENRQIQPSPPNRAEGALTLAVGILFVVLLVPLVFALFWTTPRNDFNQRTRPNVNIDAGPENFDVREKRTADTRNDLGEAFIKNMQQKR